MKHPIPPSIKPKRSWNRFVTGIFTLIQLVILTSLPAVTSAQEVSIPDPQLDGAIREALQKPTGPLTAQDMLGLNSLFAMQVADLRGLEAAHNLQDLQLAYCTLTNVALPPELTHLSHLELDGNSIGGVVSVDVPETLTSLTNLQFSSNSQLRRITLAPQLTNLAEIDLYWSPLADLSFLAGLSGLRTFILGDDQVSSVHLPAGILSLSNLTVQCSSLSSLTLPEGMSNLVHFDLRYYSSDDFSFLNGLSALTTLSLPSVGPTNVTLPEGLGSLETLTFTVWGFSPGNPFQKLTLTADLPKLTTLVIAAPLTDFSFLDQMPGLASLQLDVNERVTAFVLPDRLTSLTNVSLYGFSMDSLTLPAKLTNLTTLELSGPAANFSLLGSAPNLTTLTLQWGGFTNLNLSADLPSLQSLNLSDNQLMKVSLPNGLGLLNDLDLSWNQFTSVTIPEGLTNLNDLNLEANQLTNVTLPSDLAQLTTLELGLNQLTRLALPEGLTGLTALDLEDPLTSLTLAAGLPSLTSLILSSDDLSSFPTQDELPNLTTLTLSGDSSSILKGLPGLTTLYLRGPTSLTSLAGLTNLNYLDLAGSSISNMVLPEGLTSLTSLILAGSHVTNLTLAPGITNLSYIDTEGANLKTLVLSEAAAGKFARLWSSPAIYTYPLAVRLAPDRPFGAPFGFTLSGPPGAYTVLTSEELSSWSELGTVNNQLGTAIFIDATPSDLPHHFYRVQSKP